MNAYRYRSTFVEKLTYTSACVKTTMLNSKDINLYYYYRSWRLQFSLRTDFGYYEAKKVQIPSNQGI